MSDRPTLARIEGWCPMTTRPTTWPTSPSRSPTRSRASSSRSARSRPREDPDYAISLLLLEVSQLLLAGGRLGAISDVVPDERFEPDAGFDPDLEGLRAVAGQPARADRRARRALRPVRRASPSSFTSRLSDDIADVMSDLLHGLQHYRAGRSTEALWWWQFSYLSNWGAPRRRCCARCTRSCRTCGSTPTSTRPIKVEDRLLAETVAEAHQHP